MDVEPLEASSSSHMKRSTSPEPDIDSDGSCIICLQRIVDRTVLQCAHDQFCFECAILWTKQSRKCPLCSIEIGAYVLHQIRSESDYQKYYLPPLDSPTERHALRARVEANVRRRQRPIHWGRGDGREEAEGSDAFERAIEKRRWVYRNKLYAKHIASNSHTKHRPHPTPAQFNSSEELISRATTFIRRELQVWMNLDIQFLTTFFISLLRTMDLRSERAVRAIAEFLDLGGQQYREGDRKDNAEHFAHELHSFLRSPFRDLSVYDSVVQYDKPFESRRRKERAPGGGQPHPARASPSTPLPRKPRRQSRSHSPIAELIRVDQPPSSSASDSRVPQEKLRNDHSLADQSGRQENITIPHEPPPRKMQGRIFPAPASDNLSGQDRQVAASGTTSGAAYDHVKGNERVQPPQECEQNKQSMQSNVSLSCQFVSNYGSNLARSANRDTISSGPNSRQLDEPLTHQEPEPPQQLSIRNAAHRLRANVTRMDETVRQDSTRNFSSTLGEISVPPSTVSGISGERATVIVSASSQPALAIGSHRGVIVQYGENSNSSDAGTCVEGGTLLDRDVIAASGAKVSGPARSLDSSSVHGDEARLRLLRARIAAAKELERTLTTNISNGGVPSRVAPHETASGVSPSAGTRRHLLAACAVSAAPGTVASGNLVPESRKKPLSEEEAALRQILYQRRHASASTAAASDAAARSL